jgi:hypothetical protein
MMKKIEKENGQIFEIYDSRKEFAEMIHIITWAFDNGIWEDDDSSLELIYKDGTVRAWCYGDKIEGFNIREVVAGHYPNSGTNAIYNVRGRPDVYRIGFNQHYEDWEIVAEYNRAG